MINSRIIMYSPSKYKVDKKSCQCPFFTHTGKKCKHMKSCDIDNYFKTFVGCDMFNLISAFVGDNVSMCFFCSKKAKFRKGSYFYCRVHIPKKKCNEIYCSSIGCFFRGRMECEGKFYCRHHIPIEDDVLVI